jgi:hypothetical protein
MTDKVLRSRTMAHVSVFLSSLKCDKSVASAVNYPKPQTSANFTGFPVRPTPMKDKPLLHCVYTVLAICSVIEQIIHSPPCSSLSPE